MDEDQRITARAVQLIAEPHTIGRNEIHERTWRRDSSRVKSGSNPLPEVSLGIPIHIGKPFRIQNQLTVDGSSRVAPPVRETHRVEIARVGDGVEDIGVRTIAQLVETGLLRLLR